MVLEIHVKITLTKGPSEFLSQALLTLLAALDNQNSGIIMFGIILVQTHK